MGYFRDRRLNERNALSGTRLAMNQKQYGASIGGPVALNRTFYFAGRPLVNGEFIARNAGTGGTGSDFFTASAKVSRSFRLAGPVKLEGERIQRIPLQISGPLPRSAIRERCSLPFD